MKFIVDAQLPVSLSFLLRHKGYDCIHTLELKDGNNTGDNKIIEISIKEDRIVLTKDTDFLESYLIKGKPAKLLLVRTGNISNTELTQLFNLLIEKIVNQLKENSLIELNRIGFIVHGQN